MLVPRQIDPKIAKYIKEQTNNWLQKYSKIKLIQHDNAKWPPYYSILPFVSLVSFTMGFHFAKNISSL